MKPNGTLLACLSLLMTVNGYTEEPRRTISLDGQWRIAEGLMNQVPARFDHRVPVPGLADMAKPAFAGVGETNQLREAFWYRRAFQISGPVPATAVLKVHKATYGSRVYLNGVLLGDHPSSFTPGYFNLLPYLQGKGAPNELLIRVGASRDAVPKNYPAGWDFEKIKYLPGIFDSVELILSGTPSIVNVQCGPDIGRQRVRIQTVLTNSGADLTGKVTWTVREAKSGKAVGMAKSEPIPCPRGKEILCETSIGITNCHLWSPEDPFLYELETRTPDDVLKTRFGMREFRLDPQSGRAFLNGKPYFLRGSNVTLYRFFEDPLRGDLPWDAKWARRLHQAFRDMHWNSLRYCIGFPPEFWYDIADEEGFLIQDEYPIWSLDKTAEAPKKNDLIREYSAWMRERWNHPCVVIWDAQNETRTEETGLAIQAVRGLDLSHRPWDNGWAPPQDPGDVYESHPYVFSNPNFRLSEMPRISGVPVGNPIPNQNTNAIIINEYGWLWLNRDGTPTTLTREAYNNLLGADATPTQRRHLYARSVAALTEFWRSHRTCAGVLHFCGLGYARTNGQTCDNFIDIEDLKFEPEFRRYVRDAFAPVGLMIDEWAEELPGGENKKLSVVAINDLPQDWRGSLRLRLNLAGKVLHESRANCEIPALGRNAFTLVCPIPTNSGHYEFQATLMGRSGDPVSSYREFDVLTPAQREARDGIARGQITTASSTVTVNDVSFPPPDAVDGRRETRWSSQFSDPQWLMVEFDQEQTLARVELLWEAAYAKSYRLETSKDGQTWTEVYHTDNGKGGREEIRFDPVSARFLRLYGTKRATPFGYSLWEFRVFR